MHYIAYQHQGEDGWCELTLPYSSLRALGRDLYRGRSNRRQRQQQMTLEEHIEYSNNGYPQSAAPRLTVAQCKRRRGEHAIRIHAMTDAEATKFLREMRQEERYLESLYKEEQHSFKTAGVIN